MAALNWNQTGILSFSSTLLITILLIACYSLDNWEVVKYDSDTLHTLITDAGLNVSTHNGYFVISLNSTVNVGNKTVPKKLLLAQTMEAGMWESCSVVNDAMKGLVNSSPDMDWATDICTYYRPIGSSPYVYASGRYIRHMMTRIAQSCMIVSCICVFATLTLGTASLVIKHAILSMIASTVCAASATYQMLSMALMLKRQFEAKQHLEVDDIPVSLENSMSVRLGASTWLSITCQVLGIISVVLWVSHTKVLRGAIKLYISETKYNLFCRM